MRRWRPSIPMLVTLGVLVAVLVTCSVTVVVTPGPWAVRLVVATSSLALAAWAALASASRIDLYGERVVVSRIGRRSRTIPIETVHVVTPGYSGLTIRTGRYTGITGPAVIGSKARGARLLRITARGDRIATAIVAQAEAYRSRHPDTRPEVERVVEDLVATLRWAGHPDRAAWLEQRVDALLRAPHDAARVAARTELHDAATGTTGELRTIYLGTNGPFFTDRLDRLAILTAR
ncbi:hypothetical protein [Nocardioides maradonensis]